MSDSVTSTDSSDTEAIFAGPFKEDDYWESLFCPFNRQYIEGEPDSIDEKFANHELREELDEKVEEHQESPANLWGSFFSDLIYVCVIVKFTEQYKHFFEHEEVHPEAHAGHWFELRLTAELALYFFAFFTVWLELVQVKARFYDLEGLTDDFIQFVFLCGIIVMAIQMDAKSYLLDNKEGFVFGFFICTSSMFILHIIYFNVINSVYCRNYCRRRLIAYGSVMPILVGLMIAGFMDISAEVMECLTVFGILFCCVILMSVSFISFRRNPNQPNFTKNFFALRFGILTMILMGESVLAIVIGDKEFGFVQKYASAASSAAATVVKTAIVTTVAPAVKGTIAPDGSITVDNVLQYLRKYKGSTAIEAALSGAHGAASSAASSVAYGSNYVLNHKHYPIYDQKGAFFQSGGSSNIEDYIGVFLAFGTIYVLKNIYLDGTHVSSKECIDNEGSPGSVWWIVWHVPMYFFLLCTGAGFRLLFTVIHEEKVYEGYVLLLAVAVSLTIFSMVAMRFAEKKEQNMSQIILYLITITAAPALICIFIDEPIPIAISMFALVTVCWIYDLIYIEDGENEGEDSSYDNEKDCCQSFVDICGLEDKEYDENYHGPMEEGSVCHLLQDVFCCYIMDEPGDIPEDFKEKTKEHIIQGPPDSSSAENSGEVPKGEAGHGHGMFGEFTDLIFVAVIIKFADQMKYKQATPFQADGDLVESGDDIFRIYFEAAIYFMCFFLTWLELTHCLLRFKNMPGIFDDVMYFFYLCGVVGMTININHLEYLTERRMGFSCWYAFAQGVLVILHLQFWKIDEAEDYVEPRLIYFSFGSVMAIVAAFMDVNWNLICLTIATVVPLTLSVNSYRVWKEQKPHKKHLNHYIERFGLIIMICIGESVLALVLVDFKRELRFYVVMFSAFTTMYGILQIYLVSDSHHIESHALAEGAMPGSIMWVLMHGVAAFCLLGMGVGYKMILPYADQEKVGDVAKFTLTYSLLGVLLSMMVIRASHKIFESPLVTRMLRMFFAGCVPLAAHFFSNPIFLVGVCLAGVVISGIFDLMFVIIGDWEIDSALQKKLEAKGHHAPLIPKGSSNRKYADH